MGFNYGPGHLFLFGNQAAAEFLPEVQAGEPDLAEQTFHHLLRVAFSLKNYTLPGVVG